MDDNDLIVSIGDGDQKEFITVRNWAEDAHYQLREIQIGAVSFSRNDINLMLNKIEGTAGNDVLWGRNDFNDTLVGGKGDDVLRGDSGNDTYVWNIGDGNDTIRDDQGWETIAFGEGITPKSVFVERDWINLYFNIGGERIKFENWFWEDGDSVSWYRGRKHTVSFADGTVSH